MNNYATAVHRFPKIAAMNKDGNTIRQFSFDGRKGGEIYHLTPISPQGLDLVEAQALCRRLNPIICPYGYVATSRQWKQSHRIRLQKKHITKNRPLPSLYQLFPIETDEFNIILR